MHLWEEILQSGLGVRLKLAPLASTQTLGSIVSISVGNRIPFDPRDNLVKFDMTPIYK